MRLRNTQSFSSSFNLGECFLLGALLLLLLLLLL